MYASANNALSVNQTELWAVGSLAG
jgi:hypothetical protein